MRWRQTAARVCERLRGGVGRVSPGSCVFVFPDRGYVVDNAEDDDEARMVEGPFGAGEVHDVSGRRSG
jgi:hypothetical protein